MPEANITRLRCVFAVYMQVLRVCMWECQVPSNTTSTSRLLKNAQHTGTAQATALLPRFGPGSGVYSCVLRRLLHDTEWCGGKNPILFDTPAPHRHIRRFQPVPPFRQHLVAWNACVPPSYRTQLQHGLRRYTFKSIGTLMPMVTPTRLVLLQVRAPVLLRR